MQVQDELAALRKQREVRRKEFELKNKKRKLGSTTTTSSANEEKKIPEKVKDEVHKEEKKKEADSNHTRQKSPSYGRTHTETGQRSRITSSAENHDYARYADRKRLRRNSMSPEGRRMDYSDYNNYAEYDDYNNSMAYEYQDFDYDYDNWRGLHHPRHHPSHSFPYYDDYFMDSYSHRSYYPYSSHRERERFNDYLMYNSSSSSHLRDKDRRLPYSTSYDSHSYESLYPPYSRDFHPYYSSSASASSSLSSSSHSEFHSNSRPRSPTKAAETEQKEVGHRKKDNTKQQEKKLLPKNDYSQHFVDTRQRPQNFIRDADLSDRFEEYPKLKELIHLKDNLIKQRATAPMYLKCDLKTYDLSKIGKFDVILVDPPWEEYSRRVPGADIPFWTFEEIMNLSIESIADNPCFLFLWCGSEEGLDQGRLLLKKWGFRRCEDICWIKTNKNQKETTAAVKTDNKFLFHHTKEHCLMGIKGTVRRNQDGHLIHANVDTDIIISEEPSFGSTEKPEEMYHIIEHFSLGRRRLELFGTDHNIRPGWVTIGMDISNSNFSTEKYKGFFSSESNGHLLGTTPEIEDLRPKSPSISKNLTR